VASGLNPVNQMPREPNQAPAPGQRRPLPTARQLSSIPKGGTDSAWLYPSPQMFYNGAHGAWRPLPPSPCPSSTGDIHTCSEPGKVSTRHGNAWIPTPCSAANTLFLTRGIAFRSPKAEEQGR